MDDQHLFLLTPTQNVDNVSSELAALRHESRPTLKRGLIHEAAHCVNTRRSARPVYLNSKSFSTLTTNLCVETNCNSRSPVQDSDSDSQFSTTNEEIDKVDHRVELTNAGAANNVISESCRHGEIRRVNIDDLTAPPVSVVGIEQTEAQMGILLPPGSPFLGKTDDFGAIRFDEPECMMDESKQEPECCQQLNDGELVVMSGEFVDSQEDSMGFSCSVSPTLGSLTDSFSQENQFLNVGSDVASNNDVVMTQADHSRDNEVSSVQSECEHSAVPVASSGDGQFQKPLPFASYGGQPPPYGRQLSKRKSVTVDSCKSDHGPALDGKYVNNDDKDEEDDEEDDEDDDFHSCGRRSSSCTPTLPKTRRLEDFDPYQIFEVQHSPCLILTVKVIRGRNITLGFRDLLDTPDPYINLVVKNSPDGKKCTTVKENCTNPEWNETFTFFLNFSQANILEITLMESNYLFDINVGTANFDVARIREMDKSQFETIIFNDVSEVDIELKLEFDQNPTLRYSLCLSDAEKNFLTQRKEKVTNGIKKLLGDSEGPNSLNEVPTIAVIGSGGGFRAMTGYSGVFKALVESGVLDCSTYACGLSGSSWLLSTLYSHPKWPNMDMDEFLDELKNSIDKSLLRFFNASTIYNYAKFMVQKRKEGQPVSFTDIFGRMVGETLLNGRMETTISDQREKIKGGNIPMPLYTCVHVKKDVPAKSFQEWVEFSPYEIGMPKYGTFMDSELFGSKFFMGKLVKKYNEQPLHFLQGIWGSAFCVLFRRLLEDNRRIDPAEMMRLELGKEMKKDETHLDQTELIRLEMSKELEEEGQESSSDPSDDDGDDEDDSFSSDTSLERDDVENQDTDETSISMPLSLNTSGQANPNNPSINKRSKTMKEADRDSAYNGDSSDEEDDTSMPQLAKEVKVDLKPPMLETEKFQTSTIQSNIRKSSLNPKSPRQDLGENSKKTVNWGECPTRENKNIHEKRQAYTRAGSSFRKSKGASKSYWKKLLQGIFESNSWEFLTTRRGRAAVIHNFMRGLNLQQTYPLSPFTPLEQRVKEGDVFDGIFEMHPTSVKHIYMVDAGLTYNSPYPLVLRPQRQIDIILSFDFSARETDSTHPFKELILAEKWAKLNRLPFPPIDTSVFQREGMKELYIFRHPTDPHCPIVFHFVLINKTFKNYKAPGVPRETKEEFDFANFDVFDDPKAPFSTFNFTYTHHNFERLSKLMEFNTLLHIEDIKQAIRDVLRTKREGPPRVLIQSKDIKLLRLKSVQEMRKLKKFISRMEASSTHSNSTPSPQFYTPQPHSVSTGNPFFSAVSKTEHPYNNAAGCTSPTFNLLRNVTTKNNHQLSNYDETDCVAADRRSRLLSSSSCESVFGTPPQSSDYLHKSANRFPILKNVNENTGVTSSIKDQVSADQNQSPIDTPRKISGPKNNLSQLHFNVDSGVSMSSMHTSPIDLAPQHTRTNKESPPNPFFVNAHMRSCFSNSSSPVCSPFHFSNNLPDRSTRGENKMRSLVNKPVTISSQISVEEFSMAPEAFKADGTPVIDATEAKMYYENAKAKRKLLRRQSTITSLNSISLDETFPVIQQENLEDYDNSGHHVNNGNDSTELSKFICNAIPKETQNFDDISDLSVFTGTMETNK